MNLSEAIKQDMAQREAQAAKDKVHDLVRENPWSEEHWNVTRQMEAKQYDPELADLLDKCRGVMLPTCIIDDPPADLKAALVEYAKGITKANAPITDNCKKEA